MSFFAVSMTQVLKPPPPFVGLVQCCSLLPGFLVTFLNLRPRRALVQMFKPFLAALINCSSLFFVPAL